MRGSALICAVALLSGAVAASANQVTCDYDDTVKVNPDDCSSFYTCSNGKPILTQCPPPLLFNPIALVCDFDFNVECNPTEPSTTSVPTTPTTSAPTTSTPKPTTSKPTSTSKPTTSKPTTSTSKPTTSAPTSSTSRPTTPNPTIPTSTSKPTTIPPLTTLTSEEPERTTTEEPTTLAPTPPSGLCPQNGSSVIPNPLDCGSYIVCINGDFMILECPSGLSYNDDLKTCSENGTCVGTTSTPGNPTNGTTSAPETTANPTNGTTSAPETTANPTNGTTSAPETTVNPTNGTTSAPETTANPTNGTTSAPETTVNPTNGTTSVPETTANPTNGTTSAPETTESPNNGTTLSPTTEAPSNGTVPQCPEEGYKILPNPEDCSSFYVCVNGVQGIMYCPSGLDFNVNTSTCVDPEIAQCRYPSTTEPETSPTPDPYNPPCPEEGIVQLPNPYSCSSFYICIDGLSARLSCPDKFEFNEATQSCISENVSNCTVRGDVEMFAVARYTCQKDGTFPNPEDCGSYYVCVNKEPILMECPGGLHFDTALLSCNSPEAANCQIGETDPPSTAEPDTTPSQKPSPTPTSTPSPTPSQTPSPTPSQTPSPTPTTGKPGNGPNCPADGTSILPNPDDCSSFYVCISGDYGLIQCPPGYGFDPESENCDLAENVDCNVDGTSTPPTSVQCPESGTGKLPNPDDCASYFFCVNGHSALIRCPSGLNYNSLTEECDAETTCASSPATRPEQSTTTVRSTSSDGSTVTSKPTTPPSQDCREDGQLLPNPSDCESFFICANGVPVMQVCPPGLEFNAEQNVCDNPSTANCKASKSLLKLLMFWN